MLEKANPIVPVKSPATILPITFSLTEEDRQLLLLKQNVFESLQQLSGHLSTIRLQKNF
jgi:hypothetical protein